MLIILVILLFCNFVVGTNKVVTVTTFTTTTVCPITRTFTSSGLTLTSTKLTTSTITIAIERTVEVPGPTETLTQLIGINVTQTLTSQKSITLPTVELTQRITSYATFMETDTVNGFSSSLVSAPKTTKVALTSLRSSVPDSSLGTATSRFGSDTESCTTFSTASASTLLSNELDSTMESTNLEKGRPHRSSPEMSNSILGSLAKSVPGSMDSNSTPTNPVSTNEQHNRPTRASMAAAAIVQGTPIASRSSTVPDSVVSGSPPASSQPVISLGTLLYLPGTLWLATLAFTILGIIWGAA